MNYLEAVKKLQEDKLYGPVFIYGEEQYLAEYLINTIKSKYLDDNTSILNYEKIDMDTGDFTKIQESVETLPFMAEKRITEVKNLDLSREGISKNKEFTEDLQDYLDKIGQESILLINSSSGKFFKGSLYKKAEKTGNIVKIDKLNRKELGNFIGKKLAQSDIKINSKVLNMLMDALRYGDKDLDVDLYDVSNELEKLISVAKGKLREEDIRRIYNDDQVGNIFALTDSICNKDANKAIDNFMLLNENKDNYQVLYMIIRQFRNILNIKLLKNQKRNDYDIKKLTGLKDFEYNKLKGFEARYSMEDIKEIYSKLYETDLNLKSSKGDYQTNMLSLITQLSSK